MGQGPLSPCDPTEVARLKFEEKECNVCQGMMLVKRQFEGKCGVCPESHKYAYKSGKECCDHETSFGMLECLDGEGNPGESIPCDATNPSQECASFEFGAQEIHCSNDKLCAAQGIVRPCTVDCAPPDPLLEKVYHSEGHKASSVYGEEANKEAYGHLINNTWAPVGQEWTTTTTTPTPTQGFLDTNAPPPPTAPPTTAPPATAAPPAPVAVTLGGEGGVAKKVNGAPSKCSEQADYCQNGGKCVDVANPPSVKCECPDLFVGIKCETKKTPTLPVMGGIKSAGARAHTETLLVALLLSMFFLRFFRH